ncbi:hypothetical protein FOTG_17014 [Fusarium oxysporum f. sp. vasinfectum 25433]|uniref:Bulb-type lectin domain-containing protein n=1 Tax=Fusarium oxysporum f. sp. vasinfectum 25433 TaxID=1089449 RepID=X0KM11_FUSOX|nr:hypothetical protein FOTG_17014 [Fusarium oxysporum f. sp. vasinfectum 25433]
MIASASWDDEVSLKAQVWVWDPRSGKPMWMPGGQNRVVSAVVFSPDGTLIVSASWDTTIWLRER